jgi:hypothetical protein
VIIESGKIVGMEESPSDVTTVDSYPSKPHFILTRIVGIEINVQAGYSAIAKFEHVAETSSRSVASCPRPPGDFAL